MTGMQLPPFIAFKVYEPEQWRAYERMCERENMSPYPEEPYGMMQPGETAERIARNQKRLDFLTIVKGNVKGRFR